MSKKQKQAKRAALERGAVWREPSLLSDQDIYLFNEGRHNYLHNHLGAHLLEHDGIEGAYFAVWAPSARGVAVVGDFNGWDDSVHYLHPRASSGIWEGFIPGVEHGQRYKYSIISGDNAWRQLKADPFGKWHETPPATASVVWDASFEWSDQDWMEARHGKQQLDSPISIYEVHLGSWMRVEEEGDRSLGYREAAHKLADYLDETGFTHVELLPITEHPFFGSWGYQATGYFAPTSRQGTPQDFKYFVDYLHNRGYGVILDWVPSHFPEDEHGLAKFDGSHLFEHADPRKGFHPDWTSCIFNYGRHEVISFLISSAIHWLEKYHIDGLRVDAVASMLYLDYSRDEGEWIPNEHGGRENLEAIAFLKQLNETVYKEFPDVQTIAEESTAWPGVSRPIFLGGLGFGMKWDMGWMHDTLQYLSRDPIHRSHHHDELTFRAVYAFSENYTLPLSHDEVVHLKRSLLEKMPGDDWRKRANLRVLLGYMWAQPGKKLLFMGGEFGQRTEWNHDGQLQWELLEQEEHRGLKTWVHDLNELMREHPALHELDCDPSGFQWVDGSDNAQSVLTFLRWDKAREKPMLIVCNFTPVVRYDYSVGVPRAGLWKERLNSDAEIYGGSGVGNMGGVLTREEPCHGMPHSIRVTLPPLAVEFFAL